MLWKERYPDWTPERIAEWKEARARIEREEAERNLGMQQAGIYQPLPLSGAFAKHKLGY